METFALCVLQLLVLQAVFSSKGARIDLYEHVGFRGKILRVTVEPSCQNLSPKWSRQVSSLQLWGCGKVYMDTECKGTSVSFDNLDVKDLEKFWTTPKRYGRYWKNTNWNDRIVSYGPCENKSEKEELRDIATSYLQETYKRTISVNQLRKIGNDFSDHRYNASNGHYKHE